MPIRRDQTNTSNAAKRGHRRNKDNPAMFQQVLKASLTEKKGVVLYVKTLSIPGIVTKINADSVELRSREHSRIVVKLESIDAVAMS